MSDLFEDDEDDGPVSSGNSADPASVVEQHFGSDLCNKFEIFSYRNAASILASGFPSQFEELVSVLRAIELTQQMIRMPGGSKGPVVKYIDGLFSSSWVETRIAADLQIKLLHAKQKNTVIKQFSRPGYFDGHRIDFVNGKVAVDVEWNSKDQTYDRDLYAFSAFYNAGAIDVGIILTRGSSLDMAFFRSLGRVLRKDGSDGDEHVFKKFGASTTWMGKLLYRLDAGRNGGCPVLAIGITPNCIKA